MKTQNISTTEMLNNDDSAVAIESLGGMQISDYNLTEKIGAGGYGEVWKAIGPGGLTKAVKVLYGERDGQHAEAELKALERMRDLRHPFLLSIERIEVVNSRLIVVTELADGNLSECFEEHRKNGQNGIPRDELLGYLRDSADALDFMAEEHGLQHLDIKPDNILLQGSHAKVGDFGLAKDVDATNVSVINGFTPMFAAPELFEGRPGRGSDQYSLAIVYQLMLTGASPFNGRTAAQLTAQHLRSQPDLSHLQPIDRPVIARALSKNLHSRFDSCRQFVDELARRKHSRTANRTSVAIATDPDVSRTALLKTQGTTDATTPAQKASTPISWSPTSGTDVPRRRSIVIGAGGMAGEVLQQLKQLSADCSEGSHLSILQIDSDRGAISELRGDEQTHGLSADQTLQTPLRSSKEYRSASNLDLSWMSRRWLFNIPRSGQVDGIRPLGRLALYDHHQAVQSRLQELLNAACDNRETDQGVDVYVIASTNGGTGSGMIADIGLMVKSAIRRHALDDVKVHGLLIHGTGNVRNIADLQGANTVSTLTELRHLLTPGMDTVRGFENTLGMRQSPPFDNSYVIHLGDGLNKPNMERRLSDVAQYLAFCTNSDAQYDFHAWRNHATEDGDTQTQLRVLGISSQNAASLQTASEESGNLSALLLSRWCGIASDTSVASQQNLPAQLNDVQAMMIELKLTDDTSHDQVISIVRGDVGKEIEAFANGVFQSLTTSNDVQSITRGEVLDFLSLQLSSRTQTDGRSLQTIISGVQKTLTGMTDHCTNAIQKTVNAALDSAHRLAGATAACEFVIGTLKKTNAACMRQLGEFETMFGEFANNSSSDSGFDAEGKLAEDGVKGFCKQYCVLLSYQAIYQCYIRHVKSLSDITETASARLHHLPKQLQAIAADLASENYKVDSIPQPVVDAFDKQLRAAEPALLASLTDTQTSTAALAKTVNNAATHFLVSAANSHSAGTDSRHSDIQAFPQNAWPEIKGVGGQRRVLGLLPMSIDDDQWQSNLKEEFGDCVATRHIDSGCVSVVCEISGVPVESLLTCLTHNNPHISDVASRIHLRTDVDW